MARLELIVLVALQILLVKSFPADVSTQTMDDPESKAMNEELTALLDDDNRQNAAEMGDKNLDALMDEVPNTENSNQIQEETFNNLPEETNQEYEGEESDESVDDKDEDDESKGKEYVQEENLGNSHVFEGDIYKDKSTTEILNKLENPSGVSRDAITSSVRHWPGAKVPYVFGRVSNRVKSAFRQAVADYNKYSCIRIVPRTSERDYVYVVSEGGCFSSLGRSGGRQKLSLGRGCEVKGVAIHELMHALGFFHEQSRLDRDNYITIHWQNILPGVGYNFKKYPHGMADYLGEPYDYDSIMHYPKWAFSRNRRDTIVPKRAGVTIGQRRGFSRIDLRQLNKLYKCRGGVVPTTPPPGPCIDSSSGCPRWAKAGYCKKGPYIRYMRKKCRKSCGICKGGGGGGGGVNPKCNDKRSSCPRWASKGYCKKYSGYMKKYCPKSCNKC